MRPWQRMVTALALGACAGSGSGRERPDGEAAAPDTAAAAQATDLTGSKWRLEDLAGASWTGHRPRWSSPATAW